MGVEGLITFESTIYGSMKTRKKKREKKEKKRNERQRKVTR